MPDPVGVIFTTSEAARINNTVRAYEGKPQYTLPKKKRRKLVGGGAGCTDKNLFKFLMLGNPTGGTFSVDLKVTDATDADPEADATTETMTFNYDDDNAAVVTELETHTKIAANDVAAVAGVNSFPNGEITVRVENGDLTLEFITTSVGYSLNLTGGASWTFVSIRTCCECV